MLSAKIAVLQVFAASCLLHSACSLRLCDPVAQWRREDRLLHQCRLSQTCTSLRHPWPRASVVGLTCEKSFQTSLHLQGMSEGKGQDGAAVNNRGPSPDEAPVCLDRWLATWTNFLTGTVLIVGDGNLSFSLAMARAFPDMRLIATTYDDEDFVCEKYGADELIRELVDRGSTVLHNIDATALQQTLASKVGPDFEADCIVFNFPHHPGKGRIQRNRELVRDFFLSAVPYLAPKGEIRVSLAAGQGGTPVDKPRLWGDTWQITEQGAIAGLLLVDIYPFLAPPGYYCRGYKSQDKGFHLSGSMQHVFVPQQRGVEGLFPAAWPHDISFWVPDGFEDRLFEDLARATAHVISVEKLENFRRDHLPHKAAALHQDLPAEFQESRAFRVTYTSSTSALSKDGARELQLRLRERVVEELGVVLR